MLIPEYIVWNSVETLKYLYSFCKWDKICNRLKFESGFSLYLLSSASPVQWHPTDLHRNNDRVLQHDLPVFMLPWFQRIRLFVKKMPWKRNLEWPRFPLLRWGELITTIVNVAITPVKVLCGHPYCKPYQKTVLWKNKKSVTVCSLLPRPAILPAIVCLTALKQWP